MPRFVILRHENAPAQVPIHWDFMLEQGAVLRTWALAAEPCTGREIAATGLADHRLAYLDYEGPLSQNRGSVQQWDAGQYECLSEKPNEIDLKLAGRRLLGNVRLWRVEGQDQRWIFSCST